jgi:ABC-type iron transport system FetAB ATPase subunit
MLLESKNLSVAYGHAMALEAASFSVAKGEIVAMLGPNGAGKSTALRPSVVSWRLLVAGSRLGRSCTTGRPSWTAGPINWWQEASRLFLKGDGFSQA